MIFFFGIATKKILDRQAKVYHGATNCVLSKFQGSQRYNCDLLVLGAL
jgi:hypothetical protein